MGSEPRIISVDEVVAFEKVSDAHRGWCEELEAPLRHHPEWVLFEVDPTDVWTYPLPGADSHLRIVAYSKLDTDPPPIVLSYSARDGSQPFVDNGNHRVCVARKKGRRLRAMMPRDQYEAWMEKGVQRAV